jgi:hypothetical protein
MERVAVRYLILGILAGVLVISGCAAGTPDAPTATSMPEPSPTTAAETDPTEEPTEAPSPTPEPTEEPSATPEPTAEPEPTATLEDEDGNGEEMMGTWTADGTISEDEYDQQMDFGDMRLWWTNDDTSLYLAMEGDTTGWVAIGINPQQGMQGANFIFTYVENGETQIWDAYGTAPTGNNHPPDEDLGGTTDITAFAGTEEDGVTRFEAQIPLDSGDEYDQALEPGGSYPIIVAIGPEDEFSAYHLRYDRGELTLSDAP